MPRPRRSDEANLPGLAEAARRGVEWIESIIEGEKRELRERIEDLNEAEARDAAEAPPRARPIRRIDACG